MFVKVVVFSDKKPYSNNGIISQEGVHDIVPLYSHCELTFARKRDAVIARIK
jgi:peroxiredoxin